MHTMYMYVHVLLSACIGHEFLLYREGKMYMYTHVCKTCVAHVHVHVYMHVYMYKVHVHESACVYVVY